MSGLARHAGTCLCLWFAFFVSTALPCDKTGKLREAVGSMGGKGNLKVGKVKKGKEPALWLELHHTSCFEATYPGSSVPPFF